MISNLIIRCGKGGKLLTVNLDQPLPGSKDEQTKFMVKQLRQLQIILKSIFFSGPAENQFLLVQLDKLLSLSESILITSFHNESVDDADGEYSFEFSDNLHNASVLR